MGTRSQHHNAFLIGIGDGKDAFQPAFAHHSNAIADRESLGEVRRDDHDRLALARQLPEQLVDRAFDLVEVGRDGRAALRGTDLGLVVARRVVEAHGGRAAVRSETGQGTTFALYLPLAAEE